jgi:hypothetical protein
MKFNLKKAQHIAYEHTDKMLEKKRNKRDHHNVDDDGSYDRVLKDTRKEKEIISITEKQFNHGEEEQAKTLEARMDDKREFSPENWRDDRTHKTNTLPINELAEERQRKRMKLRGDGDGLDESHFQNYKKEDLDLMHANFAGLIEINKEIDKVYTASSAHRMTTSEKRKIESLKNQRNKIIDGLKNENRDS